MNSMNCMKCGREIALGQAFCKDCLEDMSHYPVSSTTPVQLPVHPVAAHPSRRAPRVKKIRKPEEQILRLRKIVRRQNILILLLLTAVIGLGILFLHKIYPSVQTFRPGENYISTEVEQHNNPTSH